MSAEVTMRGDAEELLQLEESTLDKSKHYRFVQERRENISKKVAQGYEKVLRSVHGVRLLHEEKGAETADDLIRVGGDLVLMMCDKTTYNARRKKKAKLAQDRLGSTEKSFEERASRRGVKSLTGEQGE